VGDFYVLVTGFDTADLVSDKQIGLDGRYLVVGRAPYLGKTVFKIRPHKGKESK
jgi:hypothetical protein